MTKQQAIRIFQKYVNNDYVALGKDYVIDALFTIADEQEIRELGFGWVLDDEDYEDD